MTRPSPAIIGFTLLLACGLIAPGLAAAQTDLDNAVELPGICQGDHAADPAPFDDDVPRTLFGESCQAWEFGGWISGGFTANAHGNRTGNGNKPFTFNNVADTPVLHQLWFFAERPLEPVGLDWGFRVDYFFGADGPDSQAFGDQGWDYDWNSSRDYGSAIPQLYGELGCGDCSLLVGYFIALKGYENTQSPLNFFYSHNYAFGFGEPGTHSGVLGIYQADDVLVEAGWTTGWDSWWSNHLSGSTFMGGLTWMFSDSAFVSYHVTAGDFGDGTARRGEESNGGQIYAHAVVFEAELSPRATYALENTFGSNRGIGAKNSQWISFTNYLFYDLNDCWSAGLRFEWFEDVDGQRVGENGAGPGSFYETTVALNWTAHPNFVVRPEIRWDWFSGQGRPFDSRNDGKSGTETSQFTSGLDVIFTY